MAKSVLVVDDSKTVRQQVSQPIKAAGYSIIEACDGTEALAQLGNNDIAMVICDVNMPGISGIELLETLREQGMHAAVPFVMLTTEGQTTLVERAKKAGAKGWIVKPFKADLLVAAVKKLAGAP